MDVLFVCLGNICRSPMAEAIFRHLARSRADSSTWLIDSAGTGAWHAGNEPHLSTVSLCLEHGIPIQHHARQVDKTDFHRFDLILAMDRDNMASLRSMHRRHGTAIMKLLGSYDPQGVDEVKDPYYSADGVAFRDVYDHVSRCCVALLASIPEATP